MARLICTAKQQIPQSTQSSAVYRKLIMTWLINALEILLLTYNKFMVYICNLETR